MTPAAWILAGLLAYVLLGLVAVLIFGNQEDRDALLGVIAYPYAPVAYIQRRRRRAAYNRAHARAVAERGMRGE